MRKQAKKEEIVPKKEQSPQEFAREHWLGILAISGTLAGTMIVLLIRYYKHKKLANNDMSMDSQLDSLESQALSAQDETATLLDVGIETREHIPGALSLIRGLATGLPKQLPEGAGKKLGRRARKTPPNELMDALKDVR